MLKENLSEELASYINMMDASEQSNLLKQFRLRDALLKAKELDKKQKAFTKKRKRLSEDEIASIVRSIRKSNAKSKA